MANDTQYIDFASQLNQQPPVPEQEEAGYIDFAAQLAPSQQEAAPQEAAPQMQEREPVQTYSSTFGRVPEYQKGEATAVKKAITGEDRQTEETRTLPRTGAVYKWYEALEPESVAIFKAIATSSNEDEFAKTLESSIPGATSRRDEKGNMIVNIPGKGESVVNPPGLDFTDMLKFGFEAAKFTPAFRWMGGIGKALGVGKVGSTAMQAAGAGGTQLATELASEETDLGEAGLAAVLGGVAESAAPIIKGVWQRLSPAGRQQLLRAKTIDEIRKLGITDQRELVALQKLVNKTRSAKKGVRKATGVDVPVFRAQATGLPSDLLMQRFLNQLDPTARKSLQALRNQNEAAFDATVKMLNTIAPEETIEVAGRQIRDASKAAIQARKLAREQITSPMYNAAREASKENPILLPDFINRVSKRVKDLDEAEKLRGVMSDFLGRVRRAKGDLGKLQRAKFYLDDKLSGMGETALANHDKRIIRDLKEEFLNEIEKKSPLFIEANEEFARLSGPVSELQDMAIGKTARLTDDQLDSASRAFFDRNATPGTIEKARSVILKQPGGKEAWSQIIRRELYNRISGLESLVAEQGIESVSNLPGKLRSAIFGNPNQRKVLMRAVDPDTRKNLLWLEEVLTSAASGRAAGSPTSPFNVIKDKLIGRLKVAREALRSPLSTVAGVGEETMFNRNAKAIADIMYDTRWLDRMSKIRAFDPQSERAGESLRKLIEAAAKATPQAARQTIQPQTENQQNEQ